MMPGAFEEERAMNPLINTWLFLPGWNCLQFAPMANHAMGRLLLESGFAERNTMQHSILPSSPDDVPPPEPPMQPAPPTPTDVPTPEPFDVPVPTPTDVPMPEPHDVPPPSQSHLPGNNRLRPQQNPRPRSMP
jgi:hypothetical protein